MSYPSLTTLTVLLLLPIATVYADNQKQANFMNGKSFGAYFAQQLDKESKAEFLKGFINGFEKTQLSEQEISQLDKIKTDWFSSKDLDKSKKAAYQMGYASMMQSKQMSSPIEQFTYLQGYVDTYHHPNLSFLTKESVTQFLNTYKKEHIKNQKMAIYKKYQNNKNVASKFFAQNGKKEDVTTLKSGLQYKVLKQGNGKKPALKDTVKVNVISKNINGQTFYDSKKENGKPVEIRVSGTIQAWQEALPQMAKGSIWELYVPENLAYGIIGFKDQIEPGEAVIYQIELIEIVE